MALMIGRKREQEDLVEYCRSSKAELICVYGRRRVGKTYLVKNTFHEQFAFAATGSEDKRMRTQLRVFADALKRFGDTGRAAPADWFEAFERLRDLLSEAGAVRYEGRRRIVFLDEFPWFATKRSDFLFAFANFWNSWAHAQDDLVVIICGSATSWIIKNVFQNTGSMYNRVTRRVYLAPFNLCETEQMANAMQLGWDRDAVLQCYLAFGGLPYYLDMLDRRLSLSQNIEGLCFGSHAPLAEEVPHLMEATLGDSPLHRAILRELSKSKAGIHREDLVQRLGQTGGGSGSLGRALDDLEKCGYIRKYKSRYEKGKPLVFQLIDPFLLFSFKFIDAGATSWTEQLDTPAYYAWRGNAFEIACLNHIPQMKQAMGIAAVQTECFPWQGTRSSPGAQIDLVVERKDRMTNICEMKYTDEPYAIDKAAEGELRRKLDVFREESGTRNALRLTLVVPNGLKPNTHSWDVSSVVTADDLFAF